MCLTKSSPMTEASRYTVRYFSRIPYIPSLNSKAALFIIRSLSWAPGDGGLPFSSLSSVKVSFWKSEAKLNQSRTRILIIQQFSLEG